MAKKIKKRNTASINLTDSDVSTLIYALSIMPSFDLEVPDIQREINSQLCKSAALKFTNNSPNLTLNEYRVVLSSLQGLVLICQGELTADGVSLSEVQKYYFSANKLLATFEKILNN